MAEAGWASDVSARTRREEGAGRPAESGTGPGGGYWTPVPALNASNDVWWSSAVEVTMAEERRAATSAL